MEEGTTDPLGRSPIRSQVSKTESTSLTDVRGNRLNPSASDRARRYKFKPREICNRWWQALKSYILGRIRRNKIHHSPNQASSRRIVRIVAVYYIPRGGPFPPSTSLTRGFEREKSKIIVGKERHGLMVDFRWYQSEYAFIGRPSKCTIALDIISSKLKHRDYHIITHQAFDKFALSTSTRPYEQVMRKHGIENGRRRKVPQTATLIVETSFFGLKNIMGTEFDE